MGSITKAPIHRAAGWSAATLSPSICQRYSSAICRPGKQNGTFIKHVPSQGNIERKRELGEHDHADLSQAHCTSHQPAKLSSTGGPNNPNIVFEMSTQSSRRDARAFSWVLQIRDSEAASDCLSSFGRHAGRRAPPHECQSKMPSAKCH